MKTCIEGLVFPSLPLGVLSILTYHAVAAHSSSQLFIIDHHHVDWCIAMTGHKMLLISLELLVCAVHPVGTYWEVALSTPEWRTQRLDANTSLSPTASVLCVSERHGERVADAELLLSLLMFLRLYLVHRAILLHSKVLLSASYRSIGSLNNINFTFRFVLKVLMDKYPARTLLAFILLIWLVASWMLTLCER